MESADLVEGGEVVCRYQFLREVAAVKDSFIGEGRRGVLLRQPRLGSVLEVHGCVSGCDDKGRWSRIFPEAKQAAPALPPELRRRQRPPLPTADPAQPGKPLASPFDSPSRR